MKRIAAHHIFCSPENILKLSVIEQDENNRITRIFPLHEQPAEPAHTVFVDGHISFFPVSLSEKIYPTEKLMQNYLLLNASAILSGKEIKKTGLPLLIDFQTSDTRAINEMLPILAQIAKEYSVNEIIAACTWQPAKILGLAAELEAGEVFTLANWKTTDGNSKFPRLQLNLV